MFWQESDVLTNGIRIHYYRSGGDKPPVVMTHGITDSGRCWPLVSAALMPDYDLIAVDARGHGKSEKPESGYARQDHAADVAGLIRALELDRPALIGHSMGSNTASVVASTYPELVSALVLEDPPWRDADSDEVWARSAEWARLSEERKKMTPEEMLQTGKAENPSWPDEVFEPWIQAKYDVSPKVFGYINEANLSWRGAAEKIQCPTLMLTADPELGARITPKVAAEIQAANPNIEVVHIPGAGHNIRREQLDAYLAAVRAFLARVYPAG